MPIQGMINEVKAPPHLSNDGGTHPKPVLIYIIPVQVQEHSENFTSLQVHRRRW